VRDRVFYNTGHGHLGWTLSAVTAEMLSETVAASKVVNGGSGRQVSKPSVLRPAKAA
jgi:D-amino-acid dehydrogenase